MKKWILATVLATFGLLAQAQKKKDTTSYPYQRYPIIPPIALMQADSSVLTKEHLKKEPLVLMYFSPSCDHCQHQVKDMLKRIEEFHKTQFVLATYQPFEEMTAFQQEYELGKYPTIKVGRDTKFTLPPFFHMESLPYIALYDRKGDLITTYQGNVPVDTLLKKLDR